MMPKRKLIRITTVPVSLKILLKGQHRFMAAYYEVLGVSSNGKELLEVRDTEQIDVIPIGMTRTISPFKDLKSLWSLYRLFKKEKPFIVHTHTPKAGTVGMIAAKLAGVPLRLHTIAGLPLLEANGKKRKLLDVVEKATYACATMIYPNSQGLYDIILKNNYTSSDKLKVIGQGSSNGIDASHFDPDHFSIEEKQELRKKLMIQEDEFVFLFVGRLVKDKGMNELLESFQKLSEQKNKIKLLLVGDFETALDPLLSSSLTILEANRNVIFVGFQKDVRPYFAAADALVFPSYREGFPNVIMQAGAMGLPSIVSDINGCNEIIIEGENGVIIPPKNTDALYKAMLRFVENKELLSKLKTNARRMIVERYEQQVVWDAILAEYKRLEENVQKRN